MPRMISVASFSPRDQRKIMNGQTSRFSAGTGRSALVNYLLTGYAT
jgi:hypothetical protein